MALFKNILLSRIRTFLRVPLIGLDVSDESAKYFLFRVVSGGRLKPERWGEIPLPQGCVAEGEIKNPDSLAALLAQWLEAESPDVRSSFFVVSLPEEKGFVRTIQLPKVAPDQVADAVRWEIEAQVPLPEKELVYDYEIIEPIEDHLDHRDVLITAFPKNSVASYLDVLHRAGIRVAAFELESQAIVRSTVADLRDRNATLIVDIGRLRTGFFLVGGGTTIFTSTVQIGGKLFNEHIAKNLGVDGNAAEAMKKEVGLSRTGGRGKEIFEALVPALSALGDELKKAQQYFSAYVQHRHGISPDIRAVLLTGGDANLTGLDSYITQILAIPTKRSFPFEALGDLTVSSPPPLPNNESLRYATAAGLALRELR